MPQDTAQLDPNYDYAKLPDGSYAKFKKGTSQDEMRSRLTAKGLLGPQAKPPQAAAPAKPQRAPGGQGLDYLTEPVKGVGRAIKGMASYPISTAADVYKDMRSKSPTGYIEPTSFMGGLANRYVEDIFKSINESGEAEKRSKKSGEGTAGQILSAMEHAPVIGPAVRYAEKGSVTLGANPYKAGDLIPHMFTPRQLGAAAEMSTYAKGPEVAIDSVTGMLDPAALRQRAAKIDNKVLQIAKSGAKDYGLNNSLQVAKEGIISTLKRLPEKIEAKRMAKFQQVQAIAKQLDAQGKTIDVSQNVGPIVRDVMDVANTQGKLTPQLRNQVMGLLKRMTMDTDPATGAQTPRNLQNISVSKAIELQKGLEDLSEYGKEAPDAVNNLARRLRGAIGDEIGKASPEMQKLRGEESRLIVARKAARENYAKVLNDGRTMAKGFVYSNWPALAAYAGLKMVGLSFGPAIAGIIALRTIAESTISRTARAAAYAKAADLLDSSIGRGAGPQGPLGGGTPQPGGIPPNRPPLPQGGQPTANKGVTPQIGPQGSVNMGVAPAQVVMPPALPAATGVPTAASRAASDLAFQQNFPKGGIPGKPLDPLAQRAWQESVFGEKGTEDVGKKARQTNPEPPRNVATSNTKVETGASGVTDPKMKAMLDRLDTLYERRASPKSGADRNAIEREITEAKRIISKEASPNEARAIHKRIVDRERLADKRAKAKASSAGASSAETIGTTAEPAAQNVAPDQRMMLLQQGYSKLATYPDGAAIADALKKTASDMKKAGHTDYDEITALAEAINFLKGLKGE